MLESREIVTTLSGETLRVSVAKGCQPLLWCLVMDVLLWELNKDGQDTGYDDKAILINGKFLQMVSEILQTSLYKVQSGGIEQIYPSAPTRR
jgi:hypothetical protein